MVFTVPCNLPTSEYAVGVGWVLPLGAVCRVCGSTSRRGAPHPVGCVDHPDMARFQSASRRRSPFSGLTMDET